MEKYSFKEEKEEEEETTEAITTTTTTTTAAPIKYENIESNMEKKNKQLLQNMKRMAQMMNQLMSQQSTHTQPQYQSSSKKSAPQKNQMMMMMPVVSMKSMDSVHQPMTADTQNIQQFQDYDVDDDYQEEALPQHLSQFNSKQDFNDNLKMYT